MSADNGIYIGRFKKENDEFSFRIIHATAIENCCRSDDFPEILIQAYRKQYYGRAQEFIDEKLANVVAIHLFKEIMEENDICEYGICSCNYDEPFPQMSEKEAEQIQQMYWDFHRKLKEYQR